MSIERKILPGQVGQSHLRPLVCRAIDGSIYHLGQLKMKIPSHREKDRKREMVAMGGTAQEPNPGPKIVRTGQLPFLWVDSELSGIVSLEERIHSLGRPAAFLRELKREMVAMGATAQEPNPGPKIVWTRQLPWL